MHACWGWGKRRTQQGKRGVRGDGAAERTVRPRPAGGQTLVTPGVTCGHCTACPATAVQRRSLAGHSPRPPLSAPERCARSGTQGQGRVHLNQGWKLAAARSEAGMSQWPLMGHFIFPGDHRSGGGLGKTLSQHPRGQGLEFCSQHLARPPGWPVSIPRAPKAQGQHP